MKTKTFGGYSTPENEEWSNLIARSIGLLVLVAATLMEGPALFDNLASTKLEATILASRPICSVSWNSPRDADGNVYHSKEMSCSDVASFEAGVSNATNWKMTEGRELTAGYVTPAGESTKFTQFVSTPTARSMVEAGHVPISYRASRPRPARISTGSGVSSPWPLLGLVAGGLLFFFMPEIHRWKARRFPAINRFLGVPDPTPPAECITSTGLPMKLAILGFLPAIFLLTITLHLNLAPWFKPIFLAFALIVFFVQRRRK